MIKTLVFLTPHIRHVALSPNPSLHPVLSLSLVNLLKVFFPHIENQQCVIMLQVSSAAKILDVCTNRMSGSRQLSPSLPETVRDVRVSIVCWAVADTMGVHLITLSHSQYPVYHGSESWGLLRSEFLPNYNSLCNTWKLKTPNLIKELSPTWHVNHTGT